MTLVVEPTAVFVDQRLVQLVRLQLLNNLKVVGHETSGAVAQLLSARISDVGLVEIELWITKLALEFGQTR